MLALHLRLQIRQQLLELLEALIRIGRIASFKAVFQFWILQLKKLINAKRVSVDLLHVIIHSLLVHADSRSYLAVGDSLLLEKQHLLNLAHFLCLSCHLCMRLWF